MKLNRYEDIASRFISGMPRIRKDSTPCLFGPGIYFLFKKSTVVYVGQSGSSILSRIYKHPEDKDFDSFNYISLSNETLYSYWCAPDDVGRRIKKVPDLIDVESAFIRKFEPKYNWFLSGSSFAPYPRLYCRKNKTGLPDEVLMSDAINLSVEGRGLRLAA